MIHMLSPTRCRNDGAHHSPGKPRLSTHHPQRRPQDNARAPQPTNRGLLTSGALCLALLSILRGEGRALLVELRPNRWFFALGAGVAAMTLRGSSLFLAFLFLG